MKTQQRLCDYCNVSTALLYCKADSAKLCLSCDREVHSTNQLFSKHTRSQLCDTCHDSPSSIFCETEQAAFCHNCDWQNHTADVVHNRRPLEGFNGCPSVNELMGIVGFEELGSCGHLHDKEKKGLIFNSEGTFGNLGDGLSDLFDWESPSFVSLDDLIVGSDSGHDYQAAKVPPLSKNRNVTCGRYKEEMLNQLRELAKLEPNLKNENVYAEPVYDFPLLANEQNTQAGNFIPSTWKTDADPILVPTKEAAIPNWFSDSGGEAAKQVFSPSALLKASGDDTSVVPDTKLDIDGVDGHQEGQSQNAVGTRTVPCFPKPARHELNSQERDSALSRYKEKKKTRSRSISGKIRKSNIQTVTVLGLHFDIPFKLLNLTLILFTTGLTGTSDMNLVKLVQKVGLESREDLLRWIARFLV
ncbi:hypothetical protein ACFE04_017062 [Oxalis oulophora]